MLIGLDIDGCIYPWTLAANEAVAERYGLEGLTEHTHWDYLKDRLDDEGWKWLWSPDAASEVFGRMDMIYEGAQEVIQALCDEHEVHFVTHRNPARCGALTAIYLAHYFKGYKGVHILDNSVSKVGVLKFDVFIDDKHETICEFQGAWDGVAPLILAPARPWNVDSTCHRFESWDEVPGLIAEDCGVA